MGIQRISCLVITLFFVVETNPKRVCLGWKTKAQLLAMHGDASIVDKIIDQKTRNQEFKEHPDAPGDISAMLFYVLVDLESVAEDEHEDRVTMEASGETHGEQHVMVI